MCGIAGYNVSKSFAQNYLDEDKQKEVLRQAWLHNLHRGWDAAGFFSVSEEGKTSLFKRPGPAPDILMNEVDKDEFKFPVSTVMGAHTRAFTTGSPADNQNNHPVEYGGVYVTHNGVIKNDLALRNRYVTVPQRKHFPDVDSAVIPLVLNEKMNNAYDIEGLSNACQEMAGAYSFHAVFLDAPGVSVIVKGTDRPLHIAWIDGEGYFYSSEPQGIWQMIRAMGVNPNTAWHWAKLDDKKFMIIDNGELAKWGSLFSTTTNQSEQVTKRFIPKEGKRKRELIVETGSKFDFLNKHEYRSIKDNKDKAVLWYERKNGFTEDSDIKGFPLQSDSNLFASLAEADEVWKFDSFYHAFYGNTEIVTMNGRTIVDVFHHDVIKNTKRFETHKPKLDIGNKVPGSMLDKQKFLDLHTTPLIKDRPGEAATPDYVLKEEEKKETKKDHTGTGWTLLGLDPQKTESSTCEAFTDDETNPETLWPEIEITWDNLFDEPIAWHNTENMFFLADKVCPLHNVKLSNHSSPKECVTTLTSAAFALAAVADLEVLTMFDGTSMQYTMDPDNCTTKEKDRSCDWTKDDVIVVTHAHTQWYITISQRCRDCDSWRGINKLPKWVNELTLSGPYSVKKVLAS